MAFVKGQSGNVNGRPKGTGYRQEIFEKLVLPQKDMLIATAMDMARNGNENMLKLFIERILPAKPREEAETESKVEALLEQVIDKL